MSKEISTEGLLFEKHGPLIGGKDLYAALGFRTYFAFLRAQKLNAIGVHVFKIDNRRGWFALTAEVSRWIEARSNRNEQLEY